MFEGSEHSHIGNSLQLRFPDGTVRKSKDVFLFHSGGRGFTFGQIVAMAGDFYTNIGFTDIFSTRLPSYGDTISGGANRDERSQRFEKAVQNMTGDFGGYIGALDDLLKKEDEVLLPLMRPPGNGDGTARAYHTRSNGMPDDDAFKNALGMNGLNYGVMALTNFDHFGKDALIAYITGHRVARRLADEARPGSGRTMADRMKATETAYLYEAFACHYLTDLFSSGHLRVDRKTMHTTSALDAVQMANGKPIWDIQSRYMHDDDSATGLLVKDGTGFQWIAYGDKQLNEGHSIVNLSRVLHAVQASVDDIANFIENPADGQKDAETFDHLKWLPVPQLAAVYAEKGTDLRYENSEIYSNTFPLWKSWFEPGKPASMGYRANYDDHSTFKMQPGSLGYSKDVPPECEAISGARFRGESQFPEVKHLRVSSGGFIQLQTLPTDDNTALNTYMNIWGPVGCKIGADAAVHNTFSLRLRTPIGGKYKEALLHTMTDTSWANINITQVFYDNADQAICFSRTTYDITGDGTNARKLLSSDDPMSSVPIQGLGKHVRLPQWQSGGDVLSAAEHFPNEPAFRTLSRFLDTGISAEPLNPFSLPPGILVFTFSTQANLLRCCLVSFMDDQPAWRRNLGWFKLEGSDMHFVKKIDDRIVVLRQRGTVINYTIFNRSGPFDGLSGLLVYPDFTVPEYAGATACALSTPVRMSHKRGLMLVTETYSSKGARFTLRTCEAPLWRFTDPLQEFSVTYNDRELIQPLLYATFYGEGDDFDCIQVSTVKVSGKIHTCIRVFHWDSTTKFSEPVESLIPDSLYDVNPRRGFLPAFRSLHWQRCRVDGGSYNGLMEVFSYYGVLGARVYAPTDPKHPYKYSLSGQVPYLGQPSLTTGLGSSARWGQSIMQYHTADDIEDIQYYVRNASGKGAGYGVSYWSKNNPLTPGYNISRPGWAS